MMEWSQTQKTLNISFNFSFNVNRSISEITITSYYLKLNIPKFKFLKILNFFKEIKENETQITFNENSIVLNLVKAEEEIWDSIEFKGTKDEIKERHRIADLKVEEALKEKESIFKEKIKENEKFVINESISIDNRKREELLMRKNKEKDEALNDIYQSLDKLEREQKIIKNEPTTLLTSQNVEGKSSENADKIQEIAVQPETKIRSATNIPVKLTEKKIPHFAARESLNKEPPYPKTKTIKIEKNSVNNILNIARPRNRRAKPNLDQRKGRQRLQKLQLRQRYPIIQPRN